eukprot:CAMPEP_0204211124 /NCGR_PEP_ID=MMETSP0361-20130328/74412_1 /ASSEMBLY_ACC=CAM_ASM_000343 /TAXON_ID=268821 /ORGANISM="Scrippsiella Hangoei, Strain SHTV-5" /LENGTH=178 /DNA_ID=CAMNT_0051175353 /DNA_START=68 /DNA_END=603 /DNA_ORIENTATION=+
MSPSGVAANHAVPPIFTKRTRSCHSRGFASSGYLSKALEANSSDLPKSTQSRLHRLTVVLKVVVVPLRGATRRAEKPLRCNTKEHADAQDDESAQEHNLEVNACTARARDEHVQFAAGQAGQAAQVEHVNDGQLGTAGQLGTEARVTKPWVNARTPSESERSIQLGPMHKRAHNERRA